MNKYVVTGIAGAATIGVVAGLGFYLRHKVAKRKLDIERIKVS